MSMFHHRGWHSSIVFGDYLYIDGGFITTWNGSGGGLLSIYSYSNTTGDINTIDEPNTLSIDLSESWTNQTVTLFSIDKSAPVVIREALWPDANDGVFYAYNGAYSELSQQSNDLDYTNQLWQFSPNKSSGVWSLVSPADSNFYTLVRTGFGTYFSGDGAGFALSGASNHQTNGSLTDPGMLLLGLVVYNTTSQEWFNLSSKGYPLTGTSVDGVGQFVSFGSNSLLFFFGGDEEGSLITFDTVPIYDPITQHWATQSVSGDIPHPCEEPCVVGAAGDNGTYEIFLYGGAAASDTEASIDQGGVYVLTLPAFTWLKQTAIPTSGRVRHSCNIIGNRQMVVVGGMPITLETGQGYILPDPWPKGIGIYDLSAMEWASEYDANAAPYVTPDIVKDYYRSNPRYPSSWSSAEVQGWFTSDVTGQGNHSSEGHHSSGTPRPKPSGTNIGAIVGGTIGGVLLLVAAGLMIWFLRRKKKGARQRAIPAVAERTDWHEAPPAELYPDDSPRTEIDGVARHELRAKERPGEAGSNPIYELPHDSRIGADHAS